MKRPETTALILLILYLLYTTIERLNQQKLMNWSCDIQAELQGISRIMEFFIFLIAYVILFGIIFGFVIFSWCYAIDKIRSLSYIVFLCLANGFVVSLKMIFKQQRPYMNDSRVETHDCECDFGYPSGHSFFATCCGFLMYDFLWRQR